MRLDPNPAPTTETCKIKRVNPAFRSVSTPRCTKDLPERGPVNPATVVGPAQQPPPPSERSADSLGERLRIERLPEAWKRPLHVSEGRATSVEQLFRSSLSEVA
jgi:hypothetical protein